MKTWVVFDKARKMVPEWKTKPISLFTVSIFTPVKATKMKVCLSFFIEEFDFFSVNKFEKATTVLQPQMRDFLRTNEAYAERKVRSRILVAFFKKLKESSLWPHADESKPFSRTKTESCEWDSHDMDGGSRNSKRLERGENSLLSFPKGSLTANFFSA